MVHVCSVVCKKFFLGVEMEGPGKYCRQKSPNERALSAFSFALFAASVPLSRQRRMRKKGNYLNTKRKKEGKKERTSAAFITLNSIPENISRNGDTESAGDRARSRRFFSLDPL